MFERLGSADRVQTAEQLAEAIELIEVARLRRTATPAREQGEAETGVFEQAFAVVNQRCDHRHVAVGQFKGETVFFENEENAQFFLNKKIISHRQVSVLPGAGINLDEYPCVPMGDDGVCSFLFVGRIMKEKGVDEFFSAARTLKAEFGEEVAFDVVGFYEDAYKEQVDQLVADGIVRFHGFQTDVHPFYEAADCVVLPSYHEGMSNVLLEGAATGRALITSDIPGCREAVEDGVSGYLCPAQDAEGLTQAMRDFAQQSFDRQVQMGQSGRALVERKFDKQLVVAKTLDGLGLPAAVRS